MTKTLIVPGLDGSPPMHWQYNWAATDHTALFVDLSDPSQPDPNMWETELAGAIMRHPDSILVGHSLGAILIARVLTAFPLLRVRAALLVAPAETDGVARMDQFGAIPQSRLNLPTTVVASRNDPYMSYFRARSLARAWTSDSIDMGFAGHINVASGFGPWARGKDLRDDLALRSTPAAAFAGQSQASEYVPSFRISR